jgi:hypothetical protein
MSVVMWVRYMEVYGHKRSQSESEVYNPEHTVSIIILDIIHRPVSHLKHNISETEFCSVSRWHLLSWAQSTGSNVSSTE